MEKPAHCSKEYYDIMRGCWEMEPSLRIGFAEVASSLRNQLEQSDRKNFIKLETLFCLYPFMDLGPNSRHTLDTDENDANNQ
jgi:hypothetical protein